MSSADLKYHFCYGVSGSNDLQQGDILEKTDGIKSILAEVHPHYLDESYTQFIVLSQTCDLVRRDNNGCKTRYITLGVIRPLSLLVEREIEHYQDGFDKEASVCKNSAKSKLTQFLGRLFNNNEPEYFYIEPQPEVNMSEPSCAFLRLSISIRAYQHYDVCFEAKTLSLSEGFRAKLGWMIGNVYSRVGTEDWVPGTLTSNEFSTKIKTTLESLSQWVDDKQLEAVKKEVFPKESNNVDIFSLLIYLFQEYNQLYLFLSKYLFFSELSCVFFDNITIKEYFDFFCKFDSDEAPEEVLRELINRMKIKSNKDNVLERIKEILKSDGIEEGKIDKICSRISSDQIVSKYIK
jgi:hypothetical protein